MGLPGTEIRWRRIWTNFPVVGKRGNYGQGSEGFTSRFMELGRSLFRGHIRYPVSALTREA